MKALGDAAEPDPSGHEVVDDGQDVLGVPPEAIEFPYREDVAFAEMIKTPIESGPGRGRTRDALVAEHPVCSGPSKRIELKSHVLLGGRHPCVADQRHRYPFS